MTTIIHVNRNVIQRNAKHSKTNPVCRVELPEEGGNPRYAMEVEILGPSKMVYRPQKPRPCGAKLWIETESEVRLIGEKDYSEFE